MSGPAETRSVSAPASAAREVLQRAIRLSPDEAFPEELLELSLEQLQILHSRICRQLEAEYLTTAEGGHPITLDRLHEVQIEFESRLLR